MWEKTSQESSIEYWREDVVQDKRWLVTCIAQFASGGAKNCPFRPFTDLREVFQDVSQFWMPPHSRKNLVFLKRASRSSHIFTSPCPLRQHLYLHSDIDMTVVATHGLYSIPRWLYSYIEDHHVIVLWMGQNTIHRCTRTSHSHRTVESGLWTEKPRQRTRKSSITAWN